jgi:molybdopterin synthase sulfur carrier subunit
MEPDAGRPARIWAGRPEMAKVFVPALMRKLSNEEPVVDVPGNTLREVVNNLDDAYPGMKELIIENGRVRPGLALAVDGVMSATGLMAKVPEDGEVHILPAIGGG